MKTAARKATTFAVAFTIAAVLLANPPRKPIKWCPYCNAGNEPDNTTCVNCLRRF